MSLPVHSSALPLPQQRMMALPLAVQALSVVGLRMVSGVVSQPAAICEPSM